MTTLSKEKIRIVCSSSNILIRAAIHSLLEKQPGLEVVGETDISNEMIEVLTCLRPDIILFDSNQSDKGNLIYIERIMKIGGDVRIILITQVDDAQMNIQAVRKGVVGIVLKNQRPETLYKAIQKVHEGEVWLDRSMIAEVIIHNFRAPQNVELDPDLERYNQLSLREQQVVQLIGQGLKNKQISDRLCISETTVRHHLTSIFRKLEVKHRLELLIFAHRCGLYKQP
jgi:DNA-binding NarL/FixJ family response regulator